MSWTAEQRTVVLLREVEGLSYDEIVEILHCPRGTVISRLFYARSRLRELLKDLLKD
jgi:RNA polymerase sigma-70 factor (ECF subfamily)